MNIEPLKNILKIYKDKQKVLFAYLDSDTVSQLKDTLLYDDINNDIYLNDNLIFVSKNTGKIFKKGKTISIDENKITIKTQTNHLTLDSNQYYIFIKQRKNKSKKNNRDFYKALLNNL